MDLRKLTISTYEDGRWEPHLIAIYELHQMLIMMHVLGPPESHKHLKLDSLVLLAQLTFRISGKIGNSTVGWF